MAFVGLSVIDCGLWSANLADRSVLSWGGCESNRVRKLVHTLVCTIPTTAEEFQMSRRRDILMLKLSVDGHFECICVGCVASYLESQIASEERFTRSRRRDVLMLKRPVDGTL